VASAESSQMPSFDLPTQHLIDTSYINDLEKQKDNRRETVMMYLGTNGFLKEEVIFLNYRYKL
jgi:hypothetical protein